MKSSQATDGASQAIAFPLRRWRVIVRAGALTAVALMALASAVGSAGSGGWATLVALLAFLVSAPIAARLARPLLSPGPALVVGPETLRAPYAGVELPLASITAARLESRGDLRAAGALVLVLTRGDDEPAVRLPTGVVLAHPEQILAAVRERI